MSSFFITLRLNFRFSLFFTVETGRPVIDVLLLDNLFTDL
jgi:hypothetical protein